MESPVTPHTAEPITHAPRRARTSFLHALLRPLPLVGIALFALCVGLFSRSVNASFAMDDRSLVRENKLIRDLSEIPTLWRTDYWAPKIDSGLYRPLVHTSYALNHAVNGLNPRGYHAVNLVLHALVTLLVWMLYRRISKDEWISAAAAFVFAAHAVHTEVVANVASGRPELLGATLFLASFLAYIARVERGAPGSPGLYAVSLACFGLGLVSKESVATILGVLPLYDLVYRSPERDGLLRRIAFVVRERGASYAGYALVLVLVVAVRVAVLGTEQSLPPEIGIDNPLIFLHWDWRILNALRVGFLVYLKLFIFPWHLSYDYSYNAIPLIRSLASPLAWITLALTGATVGITVWAYRRSRHAFFWIGFSLLTFSIVSNLLVPIGTMVGERLLYTPSIGLCMLLVLVLRRAVAIPLLSATTSNRAFVGLVGVVIALHGARSLDRVEDWRSEDRLYLRDLQVYPQSAKMLSNAGANLLGQERYEESVALLERSVEISPQFAIPWQTAAMVYDILGRKDDARRMYEGALRAGSDKLVVLNNLGFMLVDEEIDIPRGVELLERAVGSNPWDSEAIDSLGWGYFKLGRLESARQLIRYSLEMDSWSDSTGSRQSRLAQVEAALSRAGATPHAHPAE